MNDRLSDRTLGLSCEDHFMSRVKVEAQRDHLNNFISTPRNGLIELIWNALDADATEVQATIEDNGMGGALAVQVTDNGTGISADKAEIEFKSLGGSWKRMADSSEAGRALHGKLGRGRFAAYGIGNELRWESVNDATAGRQRVAITGRRALADEFDVQVTPSSANATGTTVTVSDLSTAAQRFVDSDRVIDDLLPVLAIYLLKYKPAVKWREKTLDPLSLVSNTQDLHVPVPELGEGKTVKVTILEWTNKVDRALYLCDDDGVAVGQVSAGIKAPGYTFTAYVHWSGFTERPHDLLLEGAGDERAAAVIEAARDGLRLYFQQRNEQRHTEMLASWKADQTYPFKGEATQPVEQAARELFDIVAVAAAPAVARADRSTRKLSLRLLKEAVETNPSSIDDILREVLNLDESDVADLGELIKKTSLTKVIASGRKITDRLEFLASLEALVYAPDLRHVVKERSQLHRILANETWVFREEYALVGDDQTLRTVLRNHMGVLSDDIQPVETIAPVLDGDGRERVIDLLVSKVVEQRQNHREHLVIELKRPSVHIGIAELNQIEAYANAVALDSRFAGVDARWEFWIIGDVIADNARLRTNQANQEPGVDIDYPDPRIVVRAVTWAQVIDDAKHRLRFVRESLDYDPGTEEGLAYLRAKHLQYLPPILTPDQPSSTETPATAEEHSPSVDVPAEA